MYKIRSVTLLVLIASFGKVWAIQDMYQPIDPPNTVNYSSLGFSTGALWGQLNQNVYSNGVKQSEMNWYMQGAPTIKGEFNYYLFPWLTANLEGWTTLDRSSASLKTHSWSDPTKTSWTGWSHHHKSNLLYANNFDFSLTTWLFANQNYKLGISAGYDQTLFSLSSKGGVFANDLGQSIELSEKTPYVSYKQTSRTPYIGLNGSYLLTDSIEINGGVKYSRWAMVDGLGRSHVEKLSSIDVARSQFISTTLGLGYNFDNHFQGFVNGSYNELSCARSRNLLIDWNSLKSSSQTGGLGTKYYAFNIGLKYKL